MKRHIMMLAATGLALSGCSSRIVVTKLDPASPPPQGVPWNLPMTQYAVTITRQVVSCDQTMNAKISVAVTQGKAVDPNMRYVLSSSGFWATSDITSGLAADGTSVSLNAHSEDQTATVISNVITTAAQIAVLAASRSNGAPGSTYFQCTPAVEQARKKLKPDQPADPNAPRIPSLSDIVDADNAAVAAATARVTKLVTDVVSDPSKKQILRIAGDDLIAKTDKLTADQAALTATLKVVQDIQTVSWPPDGDTWKEDNAFTLDQAVAQKWVDWYVVQPKGDDLLLPVGTPRPTFADLHGFDVSLALYRPAGKGAWTTAKWSSTAPDIKVGVPVRVAGRGRLMVCTGPTPCAATLASDQPLAANESLPIKPDVPILQLGQMYVVPMTGGTFKSELAAISLDTNGNPTSIEIAEKTSVAAAATGALASASTSIGAIPGQISAAKLARTKAETDQVNADNALVQARANAQLVGATSQTVAQGAYATAQANLATAQVNAQNAGPLGQLALLNAQNNLAVAQASADANSALPSAQGDVALINTRTSILQAQANEINAQTAIAKAKAALDALP